jgi:hypothetical protein
MMPELTSATPLEALPDPGKIKGAAFREFVAWVEQDCGAETLAGVVARLPPEVQRQFLVGRPALGLLAATWYPAGLVHGFLDALTQGLSEQELQRMALQGAEFTMERNLRGVYRSLFSLFVSPRIYVLGMQQLWNLHYDSGRVRNTEKTPNMHRAEVEDWRGHHPFICRLNTAAVFPIYGAMKCQDIEVHREACVSRGDAACSWVITWRDR